MLSIYPVYFSSFKVAILNLLSFFSNYFGVSVVITKNPVVSVLFLICLFFEIACYLIFIGQPFIGLAYLLVYVGAVSILFLFILMLINVRISELLIEDWNSIPLAVLLGYFFYIFVENASPFNLSGEEYMRLLHYVSSNNWLGLLVDVFDISAIGNVLYGTYSVWLIVTSIILLLAMVGSIVITIKSPQDKSFMGSFALIGINEDISQWIAYILDYNQLYSFVVYNDFIHNIITKDHMILCSILLSGLFLLFLSKHWYRYTVFVNWEKLSEYLCYFHLIWQIAAVLLGAYHYIHGEDSIALLSHSDGGTGSDGSGGPSNGGGSTGGDNSGNPSNGGGSNGQNDGDGGGNPAPNNAHIANCTHHFHQDQGTEEETCDFGPTDANGNDHLAAPNNETVYRCSMCGATICQNCIAPSDQG
jgi:NADH-ubiquinone oxidoreductase chain 6